MAVSLYMIPGTGSHYAAHQISFFYPCWNCPPPSPPRGSEKQEEWEDQKQEDTRRTCTTQGNDIYPDREPHCRGRRCALPPRPPPAFILKPCPCCFDNQTEQAEPHSPNHDKIMLNFAMLQRHNGTVLRCINRCFQCSC